MAKDNSFDIVSNIDLQEIDNAVNQARREAATRYDLKHSSCTINFDKTKGQVLFAAANDFALRSLVDIALSKLVRRGIDVKALKLGKVEAASGGTACQTGRLIQGIDVEIGRKMNKLLKQSKLKINVRIQDDQVRVSGKSRDHLQEAIRLVKAADFEIPLQFINFR